MEAPPLSRTLELKPYAIADLTSDNTSTPQRANDPSGDVGVDAKYSITQNLTADLTYNTDFAQVEADEQQVNLTCRPETTPRRPPRPPTSLSYA
jgi:hypothetical protein